MLYAHKTFKIAMPPNEEVISTIETKLKEFGCISPRLQRYTTRMGGHEITRYYIEDSIDANKFDGLIEFLDKEVKAYISIYY